VATAAVFRMGLRPPVQDPPLHHVPALSENAVFIDLRVVKLSIDQAERNDFLLKDLQVSVDEICRHLARARVPAAAPGFFTAEQYQHYLARLITGVPRAACNGILVYSWAPSNSVTTVRLTGVPPTCQTRPSGHISHNLAMLRESFAVKIKSSPGEQWHRPHLYCRRSWLRPVL
jgi:hypothetical protein